MIVQIVAMDAFSRLRVQNQPSVPSSASKTQPTAACGFVFCRILRREQSASTEVSAGRVLASDISMSPCGRVVASGYRSISVELSTVGTTIIGGAGTGPSGHACELELELCSVWPDPPVSARSPKVVNGLSNSSSSRPI